MRGWIKFSYDDVHDLVIATPHWTIETESDVAEWRDQYHSYMKVFNRKMDLVLVLDHFEIKTAVGVPWGLARASIHQQHTRHCYRVHASNRVTLFANTSGVRYDVSAGEAATIQDAIEGILAARRSEPMR